MNDRQDEKDEEDKEPTRDELNAMDDFLRDRENIMRRAKMWALAWPQTDLLESLRAKLWRSYHRREGH